MEKKTKEPLVEADGEVSLVRRRKEAEWVVSMVELIKRSDPSMASKGLDLRTGHKLPYGFEIRSYGPDPQPHRIAFETDLLIGENEGGTWKPRVVVEAKFGKVTTHDAITYSYKAACHKAVHPYLRYGIMLGSHKHYPLPGRLYRHGGHFDFMISFTGAGSGDEIRRFSELLQVEVAASRSLERIIYESRKQGRDRYTLLHRQLVLE